MIDGTYAIGKNLTISTFNHTLIKLDLFDTKSDINTLIYLVVLTVYTYPGTSCEDGSKDPRKGLKKRLIGSLISFDTAVSCRFHIIGKEARKFL